MRPWTATSRLTSTSTEHADRDGDGLRGGSAAARSRPLGLIAVVVLLILGYVWLQSSGDGASNVGPTASPVASAAPTSHPSAAAVGSGGDPGLSLPSDATDAP